MWVNVPPGATLPLSKVSVDVDELVTVCASLLPLSHVTVCPAEIIRFVWLNDLPIMQTLVLVGMQVPPPPPPPP